ncbi:ferredoxin reductase-like protein, partial [Testicularia cyperi]
SSASSSSAGKLDSYAHSPIPIASLSFYPLPQSPSEHKHISISLPAGTFSSSSGTTQPLTPQDQLRIRSIYIKEPSLVIERGYTPLYDTLQGSSSLALPQLSSRGSLELIVKRYADGELSRYLHRLPPGSNVEVRGPVDTWNLKRDHGEDAPVPNEIVMLVGGTGITPAYQLLTNVLGRPSTGRINSQTTPETKFKLVYAVPDTQNALLLPELSRLVQAHPEQVSLTLLVERLDHDASGRVTVPPQRPLDSSGLTLASEVRVIMASNGASRVSWNPMSWFRSASIPASAAGQGSAQDVAIQAHQARFNPTLLQSLLAGPKPNGDQDPRYLIVLVCGPDGMVNYLAGPKSRDGRTQGPLGGLLAQLGYTQEQVYKL